MKIINESNQKKKATLVRITITTITSISLKGDQINFFFLFLFFKLRILCTFEGIYLPIKRF